MQNNLKSKISKIFRQGYPDPRSKRKAAQFPCRIRGGLKKDGGLKESSHVLQNITHNPKSLDPPLVNDVAMNGKTTAG